MVKVSNNHLEILVKYIRAGKCDNYNQKVKNFIQEIELV